MAKILTFRGKDAASSNLDFLTDENQTLSFRIPDGGDVSLGAMAQGTLPGLFPDPKKDWSNQELADLFKVRQLLSGANMPVETDRGITDEGDPWFVFCHITGEVFIHLCRIDGTYVLDSPNVLRPLRGNSFEALIADFTNKALPGPGTSDDPERRVIRLERGGKIRLHPSAMLAALIWTLLMASDELVLLAPEEKTLENDDALLTFDGLFTVHGPTDLHDDAALIAADTEMVANLMKDIGQETSNHLIPAETHGQIREASLHQQGLAAHQNGFAIGLSTIAIAMGFMSEVVLLDNQRKVLESLKELALVEHDPQAADTPAIDLTQGEDGTGLIAMLADFLGLDLSFETDIADAQSAESEMSLLQQELTHFTDDVQTVDKAITIKKVAMASETHEDNADLGAVDTPADQPAAEGTDTLTAAKDEATLGDDTLQKTASLDLSALLKVVDQSVLKEFQLGQMTVRASFDLPSEDTVAIVEWIDTSSEQKASGLSEFEDLALRLTEFFKSRGNDVSFVEQENRFIAIDHDALKEGDVDYIEWQTDDGKIISLVGLHSEFQHFDMTA